VRAVASGRINYAGWVGGLGRCVKIDHPDDLVSVYGHLSEIPPGEKEGSTVERGQVIGYVGATGLATGPHLHYALERDGYYVDPLSLPAPPREEQVPAKARRAFERVETAIVRELAELPCDAHPLTLSLSSSLFHAE
jgi:murein DD-endopeptidase MepM/ murein hydrolase activator NlpD